MGNSLDHCFAGAGRGRLRLDELVPERRGGPEEDADSES